MTAASPSQLSEGTQLDHFRILRLLGKGGMGAVYLAEDTNLGRKVAIKVLSPALLQEEGYLDRFAREARHAARLNHPNIVGIHHLGTTGGLPYFAMEYVEGTPLDEVIKAKGCLRPKQALEIVLQVLEGLEHASQAGIIHRDLKPANMVLGKDRRVRVLDFGLARAEDAKNITRSGAIMGTPDYMAPEQGLGKRVGMTADVYALGVTLYQFLTGRLPFHGDSALEVMMAHVQQEPPSLSTLSPRLPPSLVKVVHRCLQKAPEDRYQNYPELISELRACIPEVQDLEAGPAPEELRVLSQAGTVASGGSLGPAEGGDPGETVASDDSIRPVPLAKRGETMASSPLEGPAGGVPRAPGTPPPVPSKPAEQATLGPSPEPAQPPSLPQDPGLPLPVESAPPPARYLREAYFEQGQGWGGVVSAVLKHMIVVWRHPIAGRAALTRHLPDPSPAVMGRAILGLAPAAIVCNILVEGPGVIVGHFVITPLLVALLTVPVWMVGKVFDSRLGFWLLWLQMLLALSPLCFAGLGALIGPITPVVILLVLTQLAGQLLFMIQKPHLLQPPPVPSPNLPQAPPPGAKVDRQAETQAPS